jgi:hypothetical protein
MCNGDVAPTMPRDNRLEAGLPTRFFPTSAPVMGIRGCESYASDHSNTAQSWLRE